MLLHHGLHEPWVSAQEVHVQMSRYFDDNGPRAMGNIHVAVQGLFPAEDARRVGKQLAGKGEHLLHGQAQGACEGVGHAVLGEEGAQGGQRGLLVGPPRVAGAVLGDDPARAVIELGDQLLKKRFVVVQELGQPEVYPSRYVVRLAGQLEGRAVPGRMRFRVAVPVAAVTILVVGQQRAHFRREGDRRAGPFHPVKGLFSWGHNACLVAGRTTPRRQPRLRAR